MTTNDDSDDSFICPTCCKPMAYVRTIWRGMHDHVEIFECRPCGLSVKRTLDGRRIESARPNRPDHPHAARQGAAQAADSVRRPTLPRRAARRSDDAAAIVLAYGSALAILLALMFGIDYVYWYFL
jgi:hypothetical protein